MACDMCSAVPLTTNSIIGRRYLCPSASPFAPGHSLLPLTRPHAVATSITLPASGRDYGSGRYDVGLRFRLFGSHTPHAPITPPHALHTPHPRSRTTPPPALTPRFYTVARRSRPHLPDAPHSFAVRQHLVTVDTTRTHLRWVTHVLRVGYTFILPPCPLPAPILPLVGYFVAGSAFSRVSACLYNAS